MSIVPAGEAGVFGFRRSWRIGRSGVVEPEVEESTVLSEAETAKRTAKDRKVKAHLLQCIPDDLLMQVAKKKTGKEVWDSLKARFVGADRVKDARLQMLKTEFDAIWMKNGESLDEIVGKLTAMSVRYSSLGGCLEDRELVKKLFDIVPDQYLTVVAGIEQFYDLKSLAFDDVVGRLKALEEPEWEARQKNAGGDSSGKGKRGDGGSRGRGRGRSGGGGGRGAGGDAGKDGAGKRDKSHKKCFKCHTYGHYANRCPNEKKKEEAHFAKAEEKEHSVLLAKTAMPRQLEHPSTNQVQKVERRSTCGMAFYLNENLITWCSQKQKDESIVFL
ncbi:unnamed protein product [Miscanthus lutarioriparius]|uniref:CCHC-type domain-containing protein n=1 Tax=Miscanthus lutarioriparius TaxID=422564 RepID=A0A811M7C3_9POAL|nr:unnamed protein product [Miscanthus lutarioriparius]